MISALDEQGSVARCIEAGAEDYLPKGVDPVLLRARMGACLRKKRARDQELAYLRDLRVLTAGAAALQAGEFDGAPLDGIAGRLAPAGHCGAGVRRDGAGGPGRESRLAAQVAELGIEIDEARKAANLATALALHDVSADAVRDAGGCVLLVPSSIKASHAARALIDRLGLDHLVIDTHPGLNEETLLSIAVSDVLFLVLRPDR